MRKIVIIFLTLFTLVSTSCKKDFDPGTTKQPNSSNGWWVTYTNGTDTTAHLFASTYNTSADQADSMWFDDLGNFWEFKGKVALNYAALTFSNPLSENVDYPSQATIANGKIMPLAGHSTTGVATDSIYLEIKFSDDPDSFTWIVSGTARTGFIDDDY